MAQRARLLSMKYHAASLWAADAVEKSDRSVAIEADRQPPNKHKGRLLDAQKNSFFDIFRYNSAVTYSCRRSARCGAKKRTAARG